MFMTPRRIQILGLVNPYLYIFSYMMDVFTHKRISWIVPLRATGEDKIFDFDSAVCSLTPLLNAGLRA